MSRNLLLPLLCLLWGETALGYELTGAAWRMAAHPDGVPYCPVINAVDASSEELRAAFAEAIDAAMLAWTDSGLAGSNVPGMPCSAYRASRSLCLGTPSQGDDSPWIWWESDWTDVIGVGSSTIGLTPYWTSGGEILLAKVVFNQQHFTWSVDGSATDVATIAVHELGHWVGLDHYDASSAARAEECFSPTVQPSVMCSRYDGGLARVPTADDALGVCYLYPQVGAVGSACARGGDCNSALCHPDGYCTTACPPSCPVGYDCLAGQCERRQPPPSCPTCATLPCGANSFCVGASGGTICTERCQENLDCPVSFYCAPLEGGGGACWPLGNRCDDGGPIAGQACLAGAECAFGNICLELANGVRRCFAACRSGFDCTGVNQRCYDIETGIGYCDTGSTNCGCDIDAACASGCSCDPDCDACACNRTASRCDEGCVCDVDCGTCACDRGAKCDAACPCDADCACSCDRTALCDQGCGCDPECNDGCAAGRGREPAALAVLAICLLRLGRQLRRRTQ